MKEMTLLEVVKNLSTCDDELTIYAGRPWDCDSQVVVAREPDQGGWPPEAKSCGALYFLEVSVAMEVLQGWLATEGRPISFREQCERLIQYATNDA